MVGGLQVTPSARSCSAHSILLSPIHAGDGDEDSDLLALERSLPSCGRPHSTHDCSQTHESPHSVHQRSQLHMAHEQPQSHLAYERQSRRMSG